MKTNIRKALEKLDDLGIIRVDYSTNTLYKLTNDRSAFVRCGYIKEPYKQKLYSAEAISIVRDNQKELTL